MRYRIFIKFLANLYVNIIIILHTYLWNSSIFLLLHISKNNMNNEIKAFYGYCECKVDLNSEIIRYLEMRVCM